MKITGKTILALIISMVLGALLFYFFLTVRVWYLKAKAVDQYNAEVLRQQQEKPTVDTPVDTSNQE